MAIEITMPKLSDTMEEGTIIHWVKQVGDAVRIGDVLAEVETDKANMELEAFDEGTLTEVRVREGESAPVGAVIALLGAAGDARSPVARPAPAPAPPSSAPVPPPAPAARVTPPPRDGERVRASPLARRIAIERGVDLEAVAGTGPGGRIVERDVPPARPASSPPPPAPAPRVPPTAATSAGDQRIELSRIRRTTAKRMTEAKRDVPHFYASADIAMDESVRLKEGLTALGGDWAGLTYTPLVLKAVGLALARVPAVNASYEDDAIRQHAAVNVGLATALDDGLMVPVVRGCDREPLAAIVRRVHDVLERARAGRFAADDLTGGTFTVSNLGMFPVSNFAAVVNPPQAAILAVGTIRDVPVVRGGQVVPGRVMTVTVSCDHRVIDGVLAGRFLKELKALLESPLALLA